jgi:hypothetical protein
MNRVIIAGGRDFKDYDFLKQKCDKILTNLTNITIISGHAKGADQLGEKYAKERGYELELYPADWNRYNKRAGPIRNEEMAKVATHLIAFWDNVSPGTKNMIDLANQYKLKVRIILWN